MKRELFRENLSKLIIVLAISIVMISMLMIKLNATAATTYESWPAVFDPNYYAAHYADAANYANGDPNLLFDYFKKIGMARKDQASAEFNVDIYIRNYPDLSLEFGMDYSRYYAHYQMQGKALGYNATTLFTPEEKAKAYNVSNKEIADFYDKSVFIGDSIMVGFRNYAVTNANSYMHNSDFLACVSYSLYHALVPASKDALQPTFNGKKMNVWDAIPYMDVDKVFIMFGTNDLTYTRPDIFVNKHVNLMKKIKEKNPNVEFYIIGMTPVYAGSERGCLNNSNVRWINECLMQMQTEWGFTYVNLYSNVVDAHGNIRVDYSSDHYVHHNSKCYMEAWEKTLKDIAIHSIVRKR